MTALGDRAAALVGATLSNWVQMAGGDLSAVYRMTLHDGRTMVVKSSPGAVLEAAMLEAIHDSGAPCPAILAVADALIVMEDIQEDGVLQGMAWSSLAHVLAKLHRARAAGYGWPVDHAFGDVAIPNARCDDWTMFWADRRLRCHLPSIEPALAKRVERLADRIADHLPRHPEPCLLHGDLWPGNVLTSGQTLAALIDPACYYGHREVDIAMLTIFSDPPASFFDACDLGEGWRERLPLYRLWPALVHLRLFGSGYAGLVSQTLEELGA